LLLVLASEVSQDSRPYFIIPILETPLTWRARSPYLYPPGTGWPKYTPGHWVPFPSPLTTRRATVEVSYPASTRESQCHKTVDIKLLLTKTINNKIIKRNISIAKIIIKLAAHAIMVITTN
jgi:hypothetical protein